LYQRYRSEFKSESEMITTDQITMDK